MRLLLGNNIDLLKTIQENSIDSIVTDPPYGLKFMNKKWDYDVPSIQFWKEIYRVLKPGGHILSFGGTRTYHRMVINIEDAGFEIRDQIQWIYGSGFPKSLNIGKSVDKLNGELVPKNSKRIVNSVNMGSYDGSGIGIRYDSVNYKSKNKYEGLGTALKPANEPICLARKPLSEKTIALNVLKWGTGGLNIDECRVEYINDKDKYKLHSVIDIRGGQYGNTPKKRIEDVKTESNELGRFPSNVILDEESSELLDKQLGISKSTKVASRFFYCSKTSKSERNKGLNEFEDKISDISYGTVANKKSVNNRFVENGINSAKTKNNHPTVKPIKLMSYLCKLITPKGGTILDPFMGSGSTGISAKLEGFDFVGIEMEEDYYKISESRINLY